MHSPLVRVDRDKTAHAVTSIYTGWDAATKYCITMQYSKWYNYTDEKDTGLFG
jgi:hypothetical protein